MKTKRRYARKRAVDAWKLRNFRFSRLHIYSSSVSKKENHRMHGELGERKKARIIISITNEKGKCARAYLFNFSFIFVRRDCSSRVSSENRRIVINAKPGCWTMSLCYGFLPQTSIMIEVAVTKGTLRFVLFFTSLDCIFYKFLLGIGIFIVRWVIKNVENIWKQNHE